jgi:FkbM family methyltransferase
MKNTALGKKYDLIKVPKDGYIDSRIIVNGLWDLETTLFFSRKIKPETIFVDIGGHAGLVSRQVYLLSEFKPDVYIVEPLSVNMQCIKNNLDFISIKNSLTTINKAISTAKSGSEDFFTEIGATMNSSLNKEITSANELKSTKNEVNTINAEEFCAEFLTSVEDKGIALKCDIQGDDVRVLSKFSSEFWSKVYVGSIELYSGFTSDKFEILQLLEHLSQFDKISFDSDLINQTSIFQIMDFYLSNKQTARNLYFYRF